MRPELVFEVPVWQTGLIIVAATVVAALLSQAVIHAVSPRAFRAQHAGPVAVIFSVIGLTYAVLLAFVAMLTWEGFNKARADTFAEAGAVAELRRLTLGLPADTAGEMRSAIDAYVAAVVGHEFPALARGALDLSGEQPLRDMHARLPAQGSETVASQVLSQLGALSVARQGRLSAADPTVPAVVWVVILVGGAMMVGFSALLEAQSYTLHLLMTAALAASGALVIVLIVSLDSPFRSDFRISPAVFLVQPPMHGAG